MATKARRTIDTSKARIAIVAKENPRREGTKAFKKWNDMVKYLRTHRKATAKQVLAETSYKSNDLAWDKEREHVKLVSA